MFLSIASFSSAMLGGVSQGILWGIMALGVYITFKILDFADMTVDGSFALGGCTCAILISNGLNPMLCLLISFLVGMVAGLLTGVLHTKLKIPGILAGILMMLALYSINLHIMGGPNRPLLRSDVTIMNQINDMFHLKDTLGDNATSVSSLIAGILFSVVIIAALYWFFGTELGSAIRATGDNEKMARAQGVNTDSMKILALMLANGLVALSGGLVCQQQRFGDVSMGIGAIVIGLASIIIGEVIFGYRFKFWYYLMGVLLGSVIYRIIIAIVLQMGMKSQDMKLFTAIVVALALSVPVLKSKIFKKKIAMPETEISQSPSD
ncbi:MAG: ABC transporter permease [Treponema sp.]|nr:ABC transporter permease [Treponema sp.]